MTLLADPSATAVALPRDPTVPDAPPSAPRAAVRRPVSGVQRFGAVIPMLIDMAAPVVSFAVLHVIFGVSPILALSAGALAAGLRVVYRAVRERRVSAFALMMLFILAATIALVFITGDPRLILAKSALIPAVGGSYGIATTFFGRTLIFDVVAPFVTKGDPALTRAWQGCWDAEPVFVRRLKLLNLIWGIGFLTSAVLRVVIIYQVPLNVGVVAGQLPTIIGLLVLIGITKVLAPPLSAALQRQVAAVHPTGLALNNMGLDNPGGGQR